MLCRLALIAAILGLLACAAAGSANAAYFPSPLICPSSATINPSTATNTVVVNLVSGKSVYVCDVEASSNGTGNFQLEYSTVNTCTTPTVFGTTWYTTQFWAHGFLEPYEPATAQVPSGDALCVVTSAAVPISITVWYDQR